MLLDSDGALFSFGFEFSLVIGDGMEFRNGGSTIGSTTAPLCMSKSNDIVATACSIVARRWSTSSSKSVLVWVAELILDVRGCSAPFDEASMMSFGFILPRLFDRPSHRKADNVPLLIFFIPRPQLKTSPLFSIVKSGGSSGSGTDIRIWD